MTSREAFETWARKDGIWEVVRDDDPVGDITGYTDFNLALAWHTWQAARSVPAAPVELPEPGATVFTMQALGPPHGREVSHVTLCESLPAGTKLYTEQQVRELLAHRGGRTDPDHPQTTMDAQPEAVAEVLPSGWVAVPVEPTREMHQAGSECVIEVDFGGSQSIYPSEAASIFRAMLAAAPKLPQGDGWLPIESAPRDGTRIIAYRPLAHLNNYRNIEVVSGLDHDSGCFAKTVPPGYSGENFTDGSCRATQWRPLPQPPQEQGTKGER